MSNNNSKINHLGIIMDGNRRWAREKLLPSVAGHKAGADNVKKITRLCKDKGIKYLTIWGLSTNNLVNRSGDEIKKIIKIIENAEKLLGDMLKKDVRLNLIGNIDNLPEKTKTILNDLIEKTKNNNGIILTLALIYGGQDEIIRATKKIIESGIRPEDLTQKEFRKYLDTKDLPIPDVIVRTGGDIRHSGFLLFDSEYSEYYFTEKKWPELNEKDIDEIVNKFNTTKRNFGK